MARLFYLGLGNFTDGQGRVALEPRRLKMLILPDDSVEPAALVVELLECGLVEIDKDDEIVLLALADLSIPVPIGPAPGGPTPIGAVSIGSTQVGSTQVGSTQVGPGRDSPAARRPRPAASRKRRGKKTARPMPAKTPAERPVPDLKPLRPWRAAEREKFRELYRPDDHCRREVLRARNPRIIGHLASLWPAAFDWRGRAAADTPAPGRE